MRTVDRSEEAPEVCISLECTGDCSCFSCCCFSVGHLVRDPPGRALEVTLAAILQMRKLQAKKVTACARVRPKCRFSAPKFQGTSEAAHVV